ncbi:hypothetical protein BJY04DRAFT_218188 [Aspergillus karnatakaensis]|uniref:SMP-30/gluconolactonase/LRE family protein n=1 Tax=Aspergillus karnatakaensis TaxID=1810916 RepID=UPI003CCD5745
MKLSYILFALPAAALSQGLTAGPSVVHISKEWNDVFPYKNFNRNVTVPVWETSLLPSAPPSSEISEDLEIIANASFIAYDDSFYKLLKISSHLDEKRVEEIFTFPPPPAYAQRQIHDGTVYVPEINSLFTAELFSPKPGHGMQAIPYIWKTDISDSTNPITSKVYPSPPLTIANGAYYFNGSVYWAQEGNYTTPSAVVRMDPVTLKTEVVKNNFYGHRFNSINDIVAGAAEGALFNPNGLAFNADETKLFVTNRGNTSADPHGGRTIYSHHITGNALSNREIYAYADAGFPDGIKTDKEGRVYAAVTGSVDVFDKGGLLLGRIKVAKGDVAVNMAWAGSWLYVFGREKIYRIELGTTER